MILIKECFNLLNGKTHYIDDYICLDQENWDLLMADFMQQWKKDRRKNHNYKKEIRLTRV